MYIRLDTKSKKTSIVCMGKVIIIARLSLSISINQFKCIHTNSMVLFSDMSIGSGGSAAGKPPC